MKKYIAFLSLVLVIIAGAGTAHACSVVAGYPGTPVQTIANKDIAFVGTVQSVTPASEQYGEFMVTFSNNLTYKGSVPETITVRSQGSSAACGYDDGVGTFTPNSVWMMYATGNASEGYRTNAISLNTKYESVPVAVKAMAVAGLVPPLPAGSVISQTLRIGSRGELVKVLQSTLSDRGFSAGEVDGVFGARTKAAVVKYQIAHGLVADGIVGAKTAMKLASK